MWLVFVTLLRLRLSQGEILEVMYNTSVGEFIAYEEAGGEWDNLLQSKDYCLGQWNEPENRLRAVGFTYNGETWTRENRMAFRGVLQVELAALWGPDVDVIDPETEYFSKVMNASECARLCLLLEFEQSDAFKELSCGGFQYEDGSNKCYPAQKWITGRKYNTSCRLDTLPTDGTTPYSYCCAPECCGIGDRTCNLDQYHPRSQKINSTNVSAVFIRKFPPTSSPTLSPTFFPSRSTTLSPTLPPTMYPTVLPTSYPTRTPTRPPTLTPTRVPTSMPITSLPTQVPTTSTPTQLPSANPTQSQSPSVSPSQTPTSAPTASPTTPVDAQGSTSADSTGTVVAVVVVLLFVIAIVVLIVVILRRRKKNNNESKPKPKLKLKPAAGLPSNRRSIHIDFDSKDSTLDNQFFITNANYAAPLDIPGNGASDDSSNAQTSLYAMPDEKDMSGNGSSDDSSNAQTNLYAMPDEKMSTSDPSTKSMYATPKIFPNNPGKKSQYTPNAMYATPEAMSFESTSTAPPPPLPQTTTSRMKRQKSAPQEVIYGSAATGPDYERASDRTIDDEATYSVVNKKRINNTTQRGYASPDELKGDDQTTEGVYATAVTGVVTDVATSDKDEDDKFDCFDGFDSDNNNNNNNDNDNNNKNNNDSNTDNNNDNDNNTTTTTKTTTTTTNNNNNNNTTTANTNKKKNTKTKKKNNNNSTNTKTETTSKKPNKKSNKTKPTDDLEVMYTTIVVNTDDTTNAKPPSLLPKRQKLDQDVTYADIGDQSESTVDKSSKEVTYAVPQETSYGFDENA